MPGYVVVIRLDLNGYPSSETFLLDKDEDTLTVIALLKTFKKQPSQMRVIQDGLHVRGGPGEEFKILRSLSVGDTLLVLEIVKDPHGNEWVCIGQNEWICRVYNGNEKAVWI